MIDNNIDTRKKIMEVARVLFADKGFEGASIREIAKAAGVNVAAVNYHFSNKENLFSEILHMGYVECSEYMREYYEREKPKLDELLVHFFRYFLIKSHDLISLFKMMMSTQHSHHMASKGTEDEMLGPPGGKVIVEAILKELNTEISDESLHWAMKCLFSHVVHTSLMYNCCFKQNTLPFTSIEDLEKSIKRLCRVVLEDLRS